MSPDKCPNSPHILTSAYLLLSSVISTSLKSPFNLILCLCPGKWKPPPPPAQFSPPSSTPSPAVCPSSLCLGTLKLPYTWKAAFQTPDSCFGWLPADHSRTEFWWGGIFSNILLWGWCSHSYSLFFLPTPINPSCFPTQLGSTSGRRYSCSTSPNSQKLGYWGQVMLRLISQS